MSFQPKVYRVGRIAVRFEILVPVPAAPAPTYGQGMARWQVGPLKERFGKRALSLIQTGLSMALGRILSIPLYRRQADPHWITELCVGIVGVKWAGRYFFISLFISNSNEFKCRG